MSIQKIIYENGDTFYKYNGKLHRKDGPAVIINARSPEKLVQFYYEHGILHNINGPAVKGQQGQKEYWVNGKKLNLEQFNKLRNSTK